MAMVYSYLRFSRPEQMKGDSIRRQVERTKAWVDRNGHVLDASLDFRDMGVSAYRGKNADTGDLARFLESVETGRVKPGSFLSLENLDRLSRQQPMISLNLIQRIIASGVSIVTHDPERVYSAESVSDMGVMLEMMVYLCRAFDESERKSSRLKNAWRNKRNAIDKRPLTSVVPNWLRVDRDGERATGFSLIPERAEVVQRIFAMALDGIGTQMIAKRLNGEGVDTFGRSELWGRSYVTKILSNRAVLGEFQPHRMENGKRVPIGEPIPDYFPRVVSDHDFYAVQKGLDERRLQRGRIGKRVTNLFTGLLKDARDGENMVYVDKRSKGRNRGGRPQLVSRGAKEGNPDSHYIAFPYEPFEQMLLVWANDLQLGDVLPRKATNLEEEIATSGGRLADIENRIRTLKNRMKTDTKFETLLDILVELEDEKATTEAKIERLKRELATPETEALDRTKELIERLSNASDEEAFQLRSKLRQTLKRLIVDAYVLVVKVGKDRAALVDILLKSGKRRRCVVYSDRPLVLRESLHSLDVREWKAWPDEYRTITVDGDTSQSKQMLALDDRGMKIADIAAELGCSVSHVSRTLRRLGRAKSQKKRADSPEIMTWSERANGWVKRHKGKRYYVSMTELQARFPKLAKAKTREGTWKAANAWWNEKFEA